VVEESDGDPDGRWRQYRGASPRALICSSEGTWIAARLTTSSCRPLSITPTFTARRRAADG
jgi:hypothetical protein